MSLLKHSVEIGLYIDTPDDSGTLANANESEWLQSDNDSVRDHSNPRVRNLHDTKLVLKSYDDDDALIEIYIPTLGVSIGVTRDDLIRGLELLNVPVFGEE